MRSIYDHAIGVINEILLEFNEIHQNISFTQKELPEIDLSGDSADVIKLKQFIFYSQSYSLLNNMSRLFIRH